jgi:hypothetical protein
MLPCLLDVLDESTKLNKLIRSFPALFSGKLGAVKGIKKAKLSQ